MRSNLSQLHFPTFFFDFWFNVGVQSRKVKKRTKSGRSFPSFPVSFFCLSPIFLSLPLLFLSFILTVSFLLLSCTLFLPSCFKKRLTIMKIEPLWSTRSSFIWHFKSREKEIEVESWGGRKYKSIAIIWILTTSNLDLQGKKSRNGSIN